MRYWFLVFCIFLATGMVAAGEEQLYPAAELTKLTYKLKGASCGVCLKDLEKRISLLSCVSRLQIFRANGLTGIVILVPAAELAKNARTQIETTLKEKGQAIVVSEEESYDPAKPLFVNDSAWERLMRASSMRSGELKPE